MDNAAQDKRINRGRCSRWSNMPHLEMQSLRGPTVTEGNRLAYTIQEILGKIGYDG
jgi:hypothetical protein